MNSQSGSKTAAPHQIVWRRHEPGTFYVAADLSAITDLLHRAYAPLGAAGMNYAAVDQDEPRTLRRLQGGISLVGLIRDKIVAIGTVYLDPVRGVSVIYRSPDTAHFGQFAIDPSLQGTGIGTDLLTRLEAIAKGAGKLFMACDTAVPAQHLIAYYRRRGYEVVERLQWREKTYQSEVLRKQLR